MRLFHRNLSARVEFVVNLCNFTIWTSPNSTAEMNKDAFYLFPVANSRNGEIRCKREIKRRNCTLRKMGWCSLPVQNWRWKSMWVAGKKVIKEDKQWRQANERKRNSYKIFCNKQKNKRERERVTESEWENKAATTAMRKREWIKHLQLCKEGKVFAQVVFECAYFFGVEAEWERKAGWIWSEEKETAGRKRTTSENERKNDRDRWRQRKWKFFGKF